MAGLELNHGLDRLTPLFVGRADDDAVQHRGVSLDHFFDLNRIDVEASRNDHVLDTINNGNVASRIDDPHVAGVVPAKGGHRGGFLRLFVIALHNHRRTDYDLAALAWRQQLAFGIHDADADHTHRLSCRAHGVVVEGPIVLEIVRGALDQDRDQRLGLAETLEHDRPEHSDRFPELFRCDRRRADDKTL